MESNYLFPEKEYKYDNHHFTIILFLTTLLRFLQRSSVNEVDLINDIDRHIGYILIGKSPGFGLDTGGDITGYFDDEWMEELGINKFTTGESFIVSISEYDSATYSVVRYSRDEICGWLALALDYFSLENPVLEQELRNIGIKFYSYDKVTKLMLLKKTGLEKWDYWPCN